ncbi:hypothetical protein BOTBODRAFT_527594 [Botryobasidium botryosum FD-172 SS1]|uniref:Uncharacterized protein n=1 Tax=Botryobasidium botryosum (strain FD-172 SS1) TaxID=930990 RepID=A0A067M1C8_BOTB1|nr:hypothetical protein BOTBODRAFT_527594 [Botryobasidium botryosum FD-172 SS1]
MRTHPRWLTIPRESGFTTRERGCRAVAEIQRSMALSGRQLGRDSTPVLRCPLQSSFTLVQASTTTTSMTLLPSTLGLGSFPRRCRDVLMRPVILCKNLAQSAFK